MVLNVGRQWRLIQSNGPDVHMDLNVAPDGQVFGSATYPGHSGTVSEGLVDNVSFRYKIKWNDATGRYTGTVDGFGHLTGITWNVDDVSQTVANGMFTMIMFVSFDQGETTIAELKAALEATGERIGLQISVQHENIFKFMHRI